VPSASFVWVCQLVRLTAAGSLFVALLLCLVACGGSARDEDAGRGGTLTMLSSSDVDFLDPGRTFYAQGVQVAAATQRTLYNYRPGDLSSPRPDLAAAQPVISDGGKTITVRLRAGVRFSPPVNREVTSRDVAYAFDRFFSANVGGLYRQYFADIVGVPARPTDGVRPISGIRTPDARTIVFHLRVPSAPALIPALMLPISAPVPEEYARPFDAHSPSTYNTHVVATGPYMVRNDKAGQTVGYQSGRLIELVRNPNWDRSTDQRPAALDAIRIRTDVSDRAVASRQVLGGSHMVLDSVPPPSILKLVAEEHRDQAETLPAGGYRFLPINTTIKPFDRLDVRRAVLAGFDRAASRKARGGATTGLLATHFLPPGIPGYAEAGGAAGPGFDFLATPGGDPALAAQYMRKAGFPSGRYTGKEDFLVVSGNSDGERGVALVTQDSLQKLGFRIRLRFVPDDALFTNWCSVPAKRVLGCSGIVWLKDYPDPEPMLEPAFDGKAISLTAGNTNYSQLDVPAINDAMARAHTLGGKARDRAWGAIDDMIVAQAAAVPLQWDVATLIRSKDVVGVANESFDSWDFAYTSLR
jgi:peptide/nickel transport system substrate-binding protein